MDRTLPLDTARTLLDCLEHYARVRPEARAYTFLADGEEQERVLGYAELRTRARAFGRELRARGLAGQAVLLLFPSGLDFLVAFFGCLYAGTAAVPANLARNSHHYARLRQVIHDAQAGAVLSTAALCGQVREGLRGAGADTAHLAVLCEAEVDAARSGPLEPPAPDTLAFLQYTSGSTGRPKGVMVRHAQLLANVRAIRRAGGLPEHVVCASWLPQFHDMGLIGTMLQPLALGGHSVFMSPLHFLQRPLRWLRAIGRYRAHGTAAPNFALELCARAAPDAADPSLDLSALRTIFCGAEPVHAGTVARFDARFAPLGLRADAVKPCFGLAEATLMVSGGPPPGGRRVLAVDRAALAAGRAEPGGKADQSVVCCGTAVEGHRAVIVDPATGRRLADGRVGEVWFAGPSVAAGYWRDPAATAATFEARTACGDGPFLRTGDLGFLRDGGLHITGRLKELMIVRGRNLHPHDVEAALVEAMAPFCEVQAAVFAAGPEAAPYLVAYLELPRRSPAGLAQEFPRLVSLLRQAVSQRHEAELRDVYLVPHGAIPRTSSGKTQRGRCAEMYASREIDGEGRAPFSTRPAPIDRFHSEPFLS